MPAAKPTIKEARQLVRKRLGGFQKKIPTKRATVGHSDGSTVDVEGKTDYIFVRIRGDDRAVWEVQNFKGPLVYNTPVIIKLLDPQKGVWAVDDVDRSFFSNVGGWGRANLLAHAPSHEWPDGSPGEDPLNVYQRALVPLRAYPFDGFGLEIFVAPGIIPDGTGDVMLYEGGSVTIDSGDLPLAGQKRYALVTLNLTTPASPVVAYALGSATIDNDSVTPPSPSLPSSHLPLALALLKNGDTQLTEGRFRDYRKLITGIDFPGTAIVSEIWESDFGAVALQADANGKIGIGTATIPHGGIGAAMLAIDGANASAQGPHIQITTTVDDYPVIQFLNYTHDNVSWIFDAYYDGTSVKSSDAGSNFRVLKTQDTFRIEGDFGITQGNAVAFDEFMTLSSTEIIFNNDSIDLDFRVESDGDANMLFVDGGGNKVSIGNNAPLKLLHVGAGADTPVVTAEGVYVSNAGSTAIVCRDSTNDVEGFILSFSTGIVYMGSATNHEVRFRTNNTDSVYLNTSGQAGIGGTPVTSALLTLTSTTGALLLPRMTTTQRDALTAADGMIIYNTTTGKIEGREGGAWVDI